MAKDVYESSRSAARWARVFVVVVLAPVGALSLVCVLKYQDLSLVPLVVISLGEALWAWWMANDLERQAADGERMRDRFRDLEDRVEQFNAESRKVTSQDWKAYDLPQTLDASELEDRWRRNG